ncbi:DUF2642 domain-containing protein [Pseudalkalibacillus hwajinpoensis]|uniref:DUF2642 domain-containing protein n=1 Tax=Guptibacillus hwajinpoensis TaxID=208199 RepID=A0A4U1MNW7_9BACL|nr:DUF2642 domain-containing protein [Pseudalkalibacillus hwajinpoensis]TKD72466.1 DUF2642 domain-containing protein [Pseudalkalibacillus hwajinpoensis]
MSNLTDLIDETIKLKLNGNSDLIGVLIDSGNDVLVLYDGEKFIYVSQFHVHYYEVCTNEGDKIAKPKGSLFTEPETLNSISFRKTLQESRGVFTEVFVSGHQSIHGYITSLMNDYIVFQSPIYKTMYISLKHLKWLIPYPQNVRPYELTESEFPVVPIGLSLARTLEEQLKKLLDQVVIFDLNENPNKAGKLTSMQGNQITLTRARNQPVYLNYHHIKTVHFP